MHAPRLLSGTFTALALALCASLVGCGPSTALSTPPIYAPAPADAADAELAPQHRLPTDTHPLRYSLLLEIVPDRPTFRGETRIDIALDRPRESLYLHAKGLRASSVRVVRPNAEVMVGRLETVSTSGMAAVRLPQPVGPGVVRLEIVYEADFGAHLAGLYRVKSGDANYAFTQFEAINARDAFPCFDEPRFKTPFDVTLRVPKEQVAIANTRELGAQEVALGLREVKFATTEKLPTYLVAFAVGPLDVVTAPVMPATAVRNRPLTLRGVAVKGRGKDLALALRETPRILESLERYFGIAYPYDKLDLLAVPDFAAGAMENAGAVTFRDRLLLLSDSSPESAKRLFASVNAHELAHQWFGDLVTMVWWDDIWLNEAFATWMATRVLKEVYPQYEPMLVEVAGSHYAMSVDSQAAARQIRQPVHSDHDIGNAFDAITYSKGGAVLAMFERYLGPDKFREGLRAYMKKHAFGNATAGDLTQALGEAAQNPGVSAAFGSFLEQPGVPLVKASLDCAGADKSLVLSQRRYRPLGSTLKAEGAWQVPVCVRLGGAKEAGDVCTLLSTPEARVPIAGACPGWIMPNAGAAGYYRWSLDPAGLEKLVAARAQLSNEEQMSLIANVLAATEAGELDADRMLEAVFALLASPKREVFESASRVLAWASQRLLDDSARAAYRAELARIVGPQYQSYGLFPANAASESGDRKLMREQLARVMAFHAEDPAVLEELAKLGEALLGLASEPRIAQLPSELHDLAVAAAVRKRGTPALDKAIQMLVTSEDGLTRERFLKAVTWQNDPAQTHKVLALSLDPRLRSNERVPPLMAQMSFHETRASAYAWIKAHFAELRAQLGDQAGAALFSAPRELCSEEDARDVAATLSSKAEGTMGGPRQLESALEAIRLCSAVTLAQSDKARAYFTKLPTRSTAKPQRAAKKPVSSPP